MPREIHKIFTQKTMVFSYNLVLNTDFVLKGVIIGLR